MYEKSFKGFAILDLKIQMETKLIQSIEVIKQEEENVSSFFVLIHCLVEVNLNFFVRNRMIV